VHVFLGKGGVGKTTCSAATALHHAELGARSLVLSTDPTPSLSHIFEIEGRHREREVRPNLFLTEFGLEDVRSMWDEKFGREVYEVFSSFVDVDYPAFVRFMTSVLPGLNEEFMVDWIRLLAAEGRFRHVVWDTAPLGQTLALLGMPAMLGRTDRRQQRRHGARFGVPRAEGRGTAPAPGAASRRVRAPAGRRNPAVPARSTRHRAVAGGRSRALRPSRRVLIPRCDGGR
jgi:anion-transporting  ArsA/GET3 family ATPase